MSHRININTEVYVKLTDHGEKVLSEGEFTSHYEPDHLGYYKFQLWYLMSIFGNGLYNGAPHVPFEGNEIHFSR